MPTSIYLNNIQPSSSILTSLSNLTGSSGLVRASASVISYDTSSYMTEVSASASYQLKLNGNGFVVASGSTISYILTSSFVSSSIFNSFTSSYNTGSFTGSFTGSLQGTATSANTASYVVLAQTASYYGGSVVSSSYSTTASYALQSGKQLVITNRVTSSYTLVLSDAYKLVETNSGSTNILTIPSSSIVNFETGSQILITQYGAGQTSITGSGAGVSIRSSGGKLKLTGQYSGATLIKIGLDEWYLFGDITT